MLIQRLIVSLMNNGETGVTAMFDVGRESNSEFVAYSKHRSTVVNLARATRSRRQSARARVARLLAHHKATRNYEVSQE